MNTILLTTVDGLEPGDAVAIVRRLTKPGSEFQIEVSEVIEGNGSSATPIAVWHRDGALVAWSASHWWQGQQTLEQYTDQLHRRTGKASTLASLLVSTGVLNKSEPLAVFSEHTQAIAARLGFGIVRRYERRDGEWMRV